MTSAGSAIESISMTAPVPPEPDVLKAQEEAKSGRPGAYTWVVEDSFADGNLIRRVFSERTEWTIDEKIVDAGGTAQSAESDSTFYGRSTFAPAPAAPAPTP